MSLMLCRWEQKNFTMKLVGLTLPGHHTGQTAGGNLKCLALQLFTVYINYKNHRPIGFYLLLLSFHQYSVDILSSLSVLTLQLQDMSHLDFFFPLCVFMYQ